MFKFLLVLEDGEPNDPAVFLTVVPNWKVPETFLTARGEQWRILAIKSDRTRSSSTPASTLSGQSRRSSVPRLSRAGTLICPPGPLRTRKEARTERFPLGSCF